MNHQRIHTATISPADAYMGWINVFLIIASTIALLFYITAANHLAAQAWRMADAQDQLGALIESRNGLVAQQSALEDRARLTELAVGVGMVPADGVAYLVEERAVAAR